VVFFLILCSIQYFRHLSFPSFVRLLRIRHYWIFSGYRELMPNSSFGRLFTLIPSFVLTNATVGKFRKILLNVVFFASGPLSDFDAFSLYATGAASRRWLINQSVRCWPPVLVPLGLKNSPFCKSFRFQEKDKTNLSHDGLNPAHVRFWMMNNHTFSVFCGRTLSRADIEGSKCNVALGAWLQQASYPCGNFSVTSRKSKFRIF